MKRLNLLITILIVVIAIATVDYLRTAHRKANANGEQTNAAKQMAEEAKNQQNEDMEKLRQLEIAHADSLALPKALALGKDNQHLAILLNKYLTSEGGNTFISPFSISSALSMAYFGARNQTKAEMQKMFGYQQNDPELVNRYQALNLILNHASSNQETSLNTANSIFIRKIKEISLLPEYNQSLKTGFDSQAYALDFEKSNESAKFINDWVEKQTRKRIKDIVDPSQVASSQAIIVNAIYFKSRWQKPFELESTKAGSFYTSVKGSRTVKQVQLMHQVDNFNYHDLGNLQVVELPYKNPALAMLILLPKTKTAAAPKISEKLLQQIFTNEKTAKIDLFLPKFTLHTNYILNGALQKMGMQLPFNQELADFRGIMDMQLYISLVIHKAFLEVDEKGSEAAAATAISMMSGMGMHPKEVPPILFRADHPFTLLIAHKPSQSILFLGEIYAP